jgi:hypothetical protein
MTGHVRRGLIREPSFRNGDRYRDLRSLGTEVSQAGRWSTVWLESDAHAIEVLLDPEKGRLLWYSNDEHRFKPLTATRSDVSSRRPGAGNLCDSSLV